MMNIYPNLRRFILLGTPLVLGILEIWHPMVIPSDNAFRMLLPIVNRWLILHLLQLPLFGLMALAVYLLIDGLRGPAATTSRVAMAIFAVFYPAFDALVGIGSSILIRNAIGLPTEQQAVIEQTVQVLFWGPISGVIAMTATLAWLVGVLAATRVLYRTGTSHLPIMLLMLAALLLGISHIRPFGPLGHGCFFLAAAHIELGQQKSTRGDNSARIKSARSEVLI